MDFSFSDTSVEAEGVLVKGYRQMSPRQKLLQVARLNEDLEAVAAARLEAVYGPTLTPHERCLHLAALRLDRETMVRVFGWDPEVRGL